MPATDGHVWGEVYEMADAARPCSPRSMTSRATADDPIRVCTRGPQADVTLADGTAEKAWVYFYNAPLGQAPRIASGDYLEHIKVR